MTTRLFSGMRATTTKTGTGSYSSLVDVDSWRSFSAITDGDLTYVCALAEDGTFESFKATKSGGASPVLARTEIVVQTDGTTNPVDWDTNTPLTLYTTAPGEILPLLSGTNSWTADQTITGTNKLKFADGGQYIYSPTDGQLAIYADATSASFENGEVKVYKSDDGASAGPYVSLRRTTASAAANDFGGGVLFQMSDAGGTMTSFASILSQIIDPTDGSEDGALLLQVRRDGATVNAVACNTIDQTVAVWPSTNSGRLMIGKSASNISSAGVEIQTGSIYASSSSGNPPLYLNLVSADGTFVSFNRAGSPVGAITVASGTVSYGTFTGHHYADWAPGEGGPEHETLGTVVCTTDGMLDIACDPSPLVRLARKAGDRAAYGVIACRQATDIGLPAGAPPRELLVVFAVGNGWIKVRGPVENGTLLWPSAEPGLAEAQPDQDLIGPWTIAKATQASPDDGTVRLVPCTLMAG